MMPNDLRAPFHRKAWVRIRNEAGEDIPPFAVMRITGVLQGDGEIVYTVAKPNSTLYRWYLVNGPVRLPYGPTVPDGWGTFLTDGGYVLYDSSSATPAYNECWGPQDGSWELKKYRYGFTILGGNKTVGSNDFTAAVQSEVVSFLCKSNAEIAIDGGTGAVSVYDGNQVDTSSDVSSCINRTGILFTDATWGKASWLGGNWYLEPWECPA